MQLQLIPLINSVSSYKAIYQICTCYTNYIIQLCSVVTLFMKLNASAAVVSDCQLKDRDSLSIRAGTLFFSNSGPTVATGGSFPAGEAIRP
jgi:hypothetical protein